MSHFLGVYTQHDGEHEHTKHLLIEAADLDMAQTLARKEVYAVDEEDSPSCWNYGDGLTACTLDSVTPITEVEAATIERLRVVYYQEELAT